MGSLGEPVDMNTSLILLACLLGIAVAQYGGGYDGGYGGGYGGGYDGGYGGGYGGGDGGGGPSACMPVSGEMNGKIVVKRKEFPHTETDASACAKDCRDSNEGDFPVLCQAWSFNTVATRDNCIKFLGAFQLDDCFDLRQEYEGWISGRLY